MLLKHVEAFYEDSITKIQADKPHLEGHWCIIDKNGVEKVNFKQFESPYMRGGQVYSLDGKYYNIETGEFYGDSYHSLDSKEFIFIDNRYDKDHSKQGVMKINKNDGTYEVFK